MKILAEKNPAYTKLNEFEEFTSKSGISIVDGLGFIGIQLESTYYFPGQQVLGQILIDIYNPILRDTINIKVYGQEKLGKNT
jgi:hypothetical protein